MAKNRKYSIFDRLKFHNHRAGSFFMNNGGDVKTPKKVQFSQGYTWAIGGDPLSAFGNVTKFEKAGYEAAKKDLKKSKSLKF